MFAYLFAVVFFTALPLTSLAGLAQNEKTIFSLCCPQDQIFINNPEDYENDDEEYGGSGDYDDDEGPTSENLNNDEYDEEYEDYESIMRVLSILYPEDYEDYDDDEYPDYEPSTEKKENKPIICGQSEAKLNFSKIKIWDNLNNRLDIIF